MENGRVTGWEAEFAPDRKFGVDMAGFAVNLKEILSKKDVEWERPYKGRQHTAESCFLAQMGFSLGDLEPFGHDDDPKACGPERRLQEILVWHTQTKKAVAVGSGRGFVVERRREKMDLPLRPGAQPCELL